MRYKTKLNCIIFINDAIYKYNMAIFLTSTIVIIAIGL